MMTTAFKTNSTTTDIFVTM